MEAVVVGLREREHVDDDVDGEAGAEGVDEVGLAALDEALDELAGGLLGEADDEAAHVVLDDGQEGLELPADELGGDDGALLAVLVAIHGRQGGAEDGAVGGLEDGAGEDVVVEEAVNDVLVAGDEPDSLFRMLPDGVLVA